MRDMCARGETSVFIDHKLDEVLEIADTITVLRAGRTVATVKPDVSLGGKGSHARLCCAPR